MATTDLLRATVLVTIDAEALSPPSRRALWCAVVAESSADRYAVDGAAPSPLPSGLAAVGLEGREVRLLVGDGWVASASHRGSSFRFVLPVERWHRVRALADALVPRVRYVVTDG